MSLEFKQVLPEGTSILFLDNEWLGGELAICVQMIENDKVIAACAMTLTVDQVRQLMAYCGQTLAEGDVS